MTGVPARPDYSDHPWAGRYVADGLGGFQLVPTSEAVRRDDANFRALVGDDAYQANKTWSARSARRKRKALAGQSKYDDSLIDAGYLRH